MSRTVVLQQECEAGISSQSPAILRQHSRSSVVSAASGCKQAISGDANTESANTRALSLQTNFTLDSVLGCGHLVQLRTRTNAQRPWSHCRLFRLRPVPIPRLDPDGAQGHQVDVGYLKAVESKDALNQSEYRTAPRLCGSIRCTTRWGFLGYAGLLL